MKWLLLIGLVLLTACSRSVSEQPQGCTKEFVPVCANDGQTYANECMALLEGMIVVSQGSCEDLTETVFCTADYDPVCGVDNVTYSNRCVAERQNGVQVKHIGSCESTCPQTLDPVCGDNNQTYQNNCQAQNAGVTYTQGACTTQEPALGDLVITVNPDRSVTTNNAVLEKGLVATVAISNKASHSVRIEIAQLNLRQDLPEGHNQIIEIVPKYSGIYPIILNGASASQFKVE